MNRDTRRAKRGYRDIDGKRGSARGLKQHMADLASGCMCEAWEGERLAAQYWLARKGLA